MIKFEDVTKSYTGKIGCMCGCLGTYQIPTHVGVEAANKEIGYEGYSKCSDRSVKSTLTKINKAIDWNDPDDVKKHVDYDYGYAAIETDTGRQLVVYFNTEGQDNAEV